MRAPRRRSTTRCPADPRPSTNGTTPVAVATGVAYVGNNAPQHTAETGGCLEPAVATCILHCPCNLWTPCGGADRSVSRMHPPETPPSGGGAARRASLPVKSSSRGERSSPRCVWGCPPSSRRLTESTARRARRRLHRTPRRCSPRLACREHRRQPMDTVAALSRFRYPRPQYRSATRRSDHHGSPQPAGVRLPAPRALATWSTRYPSELRSQQPHGRRLLRELRCPRPRRSCRGGTPSPCAVGLGADASADRHHADEPRHLGAAS